MSSKKKELTLQETFYNLCKDLIRYIDKKIVRKYISPNQAQIPKEKRNIEKKPKDNKWRYFFEDEDTTEDDRIKDIFKDNIFLSNLQRLYNELNVIVSKMEENKNNQENLNKKIKSYKEVNDQLINYFMEKNINLSSVNKDDINIALQTLQKNKEKKEDLKNNENMNNIGLMEGNNMSDINIINNQNKKRITPDNKVISNLIQALDILNKNQKQKAKEKEKEKEKSQLMKNIFESDSNDEEEEEEEEVNKYLGNENKKENIFLNKKIKRNNK